MRIGEICFSKSARLADGFPFAVVIACFFVNSDEFARPMIRVSAKEGGSSDGNDF